MCPRRVAFRGACRTPAVPRRDAVEAARRKVDANQPELSIAGQRADLPPRLVTQALLTEAQGDRLLLQFIDHRQNVDEADVARVLDAARGLVDS
jgi:hypothetical protein